MAIDVLNDRSYKSGISDVAASKSAAAKAKLSTDSVDSAKSYISEDAVNLTDSAKSLSNATNIARNSSGIDEAKVARLKAAINDGSYEINYDSIANKIVDSEDELRSFF